ncbi:hypothetical protein MKW94_014033 [Papaver nudicaule]|uniref:Transposase n=1 Tax=Papaver nudicaule TaxID=74823 RepID=A0AA41S2B4_PAPNU|nr:hypothetical protein [Papaver nudicaule]
MKERFDKYWKLTSKTFAVACILDPRFKLKSVDYYFPLIYVNSEKKKAKIKAILFKLYDKYARCYASSSHVYSGNIPTDDVVVDRSVGGSGNSVSSSSFASSSRSLAPSSSSFTAKLKGFTSFLEETSQNTVVVTDLEQYLKDDAHPIKKGTGEINLNDASFDVLGWWKFYGPKYPIVALMARDILGIPASSVASESVFSTSGRVIGKYRSSLLPDTIEALICGQDYIRNGLEKDGLGLENPALGTIFDVMNELQENGFDEASNIEEQ